MNPREEVATRVQELAYELHVAQAMTRNVLTIHPRTQISTVSQILRKRRISGLPVIDKGKLCGLISIEDVIKCLVNNELNRRVSSLMTRSVVTVYSDEPVVKAIQIFERFGYGRLPVLDRNDHSVVGILTKGDIIRALLKKMDVDYREEEILRYRASHIFNDVTADEVHLIFEFSVRGGNFDRAGEASSQLRTNLLRLGIHPEIVRRIAISTYEAEMNLVIYTHGGRIVADLQKDLIQIRVLDQGPGIPDIEKAMEAGYSTAPDWVRELGFGAGMGLPNIRKHSDWMQLTSEMGRYTHLEFEVKVP
ncbi:MAG TPA: CBS domain-containing protein [Thermoanaerobaculia bacterium]|nr:CBS domain-containing protein [Thermoanaerobaculia bacterium]HUM28641.1 CBS domain-containing protein [Thermoanaerobaculia bacterium]HXK66751.1 CBS domain-containing protein [Thermoanaerobaculia bacterium]